MPTPPEENTALPLLHWELLKCQLLWAFDSTLVPNTQNHAYYPYATAAWFLRKGTLTLSSPNRPDEHYESGTWVFPRSAPGHQMFSPDTHLLSIRYFAEWPTGQALFDRTETISFSHDEAPELLEIATALSDRISDSGGGRSGQNTYPQVTLNDFLDFQVPFAQWINAVWRALRKLGHEPCMMGGLHEPVRRCLDYLKNRDLSRRFREIELTEIVGLSVSQINKLFAQQANTTPGIFWNHRRLSVAQSKLIASDESIKSIAYSLGFLSSETFSRWFHAQTGYSASAFRSLGKGGKAFFHSSMAAVRKSRRKET